MLIPKMVGKAGVPHKSGTTELKYRCWRYTCHRKSAWVRCRHDFGEETGSIQGISTGSLKSAKAKPNSNAEFFFIAYPPKYSNHFRGVLRSSLSREGLCACDTHIARNPFEMHIASQIAPRERAARARVCDDRTNAGRLRISANTHPQSPAAEAKDDEQEHATPLFSLSVRVQAPTVAVRGVCACGRLRVRV